MGRPGGTLPQLFHVPPANQKDHNVPKEELLQFEGLVLEILPDVTVEVSPYDLEKGRLVFRHKDERAGSATRPIQRPQFRRR
jgi:hypothetical protein